MPKSCVAVGCTNHNMMGKDLSFHIFPDKVKKNEKWKKWVQAMKRINADGSAWQPGSNYVYVCSEHFKTGRPSGDPNHPDYIPNVFPFKKEDELKSKMQLQRYESAKKRAKYEIQIQPTPRDSASSSVEEKEPVQQSFEILESITVDEPELSEAMEIDFLRRERNHLLTKISCIEQQVLLSTYNPSVMRDNDDAAKYLTGLSYKVFTIISEMLIPHLNLMGQSKLPPENQILLVLVRLRLNLPFQFLSMQTKLALSTINVIFQKVVDVMYQNLKFLIHWPDRENIRQTIPPVFKANFPRLTSIIDCFEIFVERPTNLKARAQVYSNYKKHSTVKFLICTNPLGAITFLSPAWGGRSTDNQIVRDSGFISSNYHHPWDQILADRGFTLEDDFAALCSAELIIPAFTKGKKQLSAKEVETTRKIANVRIHVERVIGNMKKRFGILSQGSLPINLVKSQSNEVKGETPNIEKLVTVCASLTNLMPSIVYKEEKK